MRRDARGGLGAGQLGSGREHAPDVSAWRSGPRGGWGSGRGVGEGCQELMVECARPSLGLEEAEAETIERSPAGPNPARQRLTSSRKRVLRGRGRPRQRSVDSERAGRVIEPRKQSTTGADAVQRAEGSTGAPSRSGAEVPSGSESGARAHWGSPGTWEISSSLSFTTGWGTRTPPPARGWRARRPRERTASTGRVPAREGNGARRDGRRGVGTPRSTAEAGEAARATPWREGGVGTRNCWRER